PLKREQDFERFRGRRVVIRTRAPLDGRRHFTGVLEGLVDGAVKLSLDGQGVVSIPRAEMTQARLVAEFSWEGKK
ncbi:MAG TPA: ribosome maturation factor RimP, partial [Firmicutes bacterium]|nr:ribosome maturation factor RimP [Bacillota bacterium]